jgi:radical SAM protein with 4Fe4S-binding SPASM domain
VDEKKPANRTIEEWHGYMESCCDIAHESVYGVARERGHDCDHEVVGQLEIQMETTSTCNASCHFCPYEKLGRVGGLMPMWLFKKIVEEAATLPAVHRYVLHGLGEPLLDRYLEDRIWYIKETDKRKVTIEIYTNGVYLIPSRFEALKKAGVTSLMISLNAVRPKQHEQIMGLKGKFERVCSNIDYAIENQGDMAIQVHAVSNGDQFTEEDAFAFYARWGYRTHEGHGICIRENNWAGDNRTAHQNWKPNEACGRALEQIYIDYNGNVTTCCLDPSGKQIFGNLEYRTLREIYNSDKYLRFREAHAGDRADEYDICRNCTRT